jgi:hypothetical protein
MLSGVRRFLAFAAAISCVVVASAGVPPGAAAQDDPVPAAEETVWLCLPGQRDDPCSPSLETTRVSATNEPLGVRNVRAARRPAIDCFYVYPTVSDQPAPQADLSVDPELRSIALYQAAYFSKVCDVFAPVYRQRTLRGIGIGGAPGAGGAPEDVPTNYESVLGAWRTYLEEHNDGRGVVFVGHSQGSGMLAQLLAREVDGDPALRRRLVSAILLGGSVTVREGEDVGGTFEHIPACRSARQLGCVMAFNTFNAPVPPDSIFGRTSTPGEEVLCTNPAALGGGAARLDGVFPTEPFAPGTIAAGIGLLGIGPPPEVTTPWVEYRNSYRGECSSADGADVLHIEAINGAPTITAVPSATWGLHLADGNIALGDFVRVVQRQAAAYGERNGR